MLRDTPYGKFWAETDQELITFVRSEGGRIYRRELKLAIHARLDQQADALGLKSAEFAGSIRGNTGDHTSRQARAFAEWRDDVMTAARAHLAGLTDIPEDVTPFLDSLPSFDMSAAPKTVTQRQMRLAMLGAGVLDQVQAAFDALPPESRALQIEWDYATEITRVSPLSAVIKSTGITNAQLTQLFRTALTL
jgi:hypothetical protein